MNPEASRIYFNLFDKLSSRWVGSSTDMSKTAAHSLKVPARTKEASAAAGSIGWGKLLAGAAGIGGLGYGSYRLGKYMGDKDDEFNRNLAFGGGLAAGLAAPSVIEGLRGLASHQGYSPGYTGYEDIDPYAYNFTGI